jgi:hypothetical protein
MLVQSSDSLEIFKIVFMKSDLRKQTSKEAIATITKAITVDKFNRLKQFTNIVQLLKEICDGQRLQKVGIYAHQGIYL